MRIKGLMVHIPGKGLTYFGTLFLILDSHYYYICEMKTSGIKYAFLFCFILFTLKGNAQLSPNDTTLNIPMFYASYAYQLPGGDLSDRFGPNSVIGAGFQFKSRQNWLFGANFDFIFGNQVNNGDSLLFNLKTQKGHIINLAGNFAEYSLLERGYTITAKFGKIFPVLSPNPNSGFIITASAGYIQHKIRIEVFNNTAPQLLGDYEKGYDRLAGGFMISEFVGYIYLSDNRLLNFFGGFEFTQSWTSPKRDVNFDTMEPDQKTNRFDVLNGFKIGWILPIFQRQPEKFYYY